MWLVVGEQIQIFIVVADSLGKNKLTLIISSFKNISFCLHLSKTS
jgi:hypothetical protein